MIIRLACVLVLSLFLAITPQLPSALAQNVGPVANEAALQLGSAANAEYTTQCRREGLSCSLVYAESASERAKITDTPQIIPNEPVISGPLAIVVVILALMAIIGLWLRFGGGGVLLSSAPREMKRPQGEAPESWRTSLQEEDEKPEQFLRRIAAMEDRRQALIQLLRRCLLHAADTTGTRLFRADTERTVMGRLPADMPGRSGLEKLLRDTELVHYGGRVPGESQFAALLTTAQGLLLNGGRADA